MKVLPKSSCRYTFGAGIVSYGNGDIGILADSRSNYKPEKGGIHPTEAAKHHKETAEETLHNALKKAKVHLADIDFIAYSAGPGLAPCLKVTLEFAAKLAEESRKKLLPVNHAVAHIEIGRALAECKDPVIMYVSGGNTQIISYANGRYRVFGETLDIAIGNAIDTLMRECGQGFPGGPVMEKLAENGKYIELPYVVKGMDLSFAGIVTAALKKFKEGTKLEDVCFSFQETCYAMLTEVAERAMAHLKKGELLLVGGVAASQRLTGMMRVMCKERGAEFYACPLEYAGDNGVNIAAAGAVQAAAGDKGIEPAKADFDSRWRVDEVEVVWI